MAFFDELKKSPAMTDAELADTAKQIFREIRGSCLALKQTGEHQLTRVYGWHRFVPPVWQKRDPAYYPVTMGGPEEADRYGTDGYFAGCTEQNRNRILARLASLLRAEGFPEECAAPVSVRLKSGEICHLIRVSIRW